ncbi:MAG: ABC transporter permease, partial [Chloroflexota bacterium]
MSQYLARRVMQFVPVAFAVSVVIFVLLRVLPGDVARLLLMGPQGGGVADPEQIERLRAELGLNLPLYQQYLNWVQDLVRWDLGKSYWSGEPIAAIVARTFPVTLQLAVLTAVMAMIIALPVGIISAIRQDT